MDAVFRFGIEEEYFLADAETGATPDADVADAFHRARGAEVKPASHEFLKGQVEVQTEPTTSFEEARDQLLAARLGLAKVAEEHGLLLLAAGSHPLARARDQDTTEKERYQRLLAELGVIAPRAMICAMHTHVETPEPDGRVRLMNRLTPFLPLMLALSSSSPFWQGRDTGLHSYRLTAFAQWPRTGLPEMFADEDEYRRFVELMVAGGVIDDASFLWWHIRPSVRFPTVELRVCDCCTRVDDAVALAALYQALTRCLVRRPEINAEVGVVDRGVCASNLWQVQQHGLEARLIDARSGETRTVGEQLDAVLALVESDAAALGSTDWIARCRAIAAGGTSADRQRALFRAAKERTTSDTHALREVIRTLAAVTVGRGEF
ncbi:carboxylate-amine ligase [Methylopila turkensis]|uniref:Putative glutamate--cysteine ligase 2 n=1 Tax=Methylopila turkensis TaxID=1437816 RepID=A0A9W6JQ54_9HYPH|nr:carboxylate-amine ligase [Methylopila turkensis]GLK79598.1 putative glutamate--cysteine ligase 2 [Methylopila turkensis]